MLKKRRIPGKLQPMDQICFEGVEAILFDFEGTLVDSQWNRTGAVQETLKKLNDLGFPIDRFQGMKYSVLMREAMRIAPEMDRSSLEVRGVIEAIYDRYDEDALSRWTLRPGAKEFLHALKARRIKTGLVSNAGKSVLKKAFAKFDLGGFLGVVLSRNDVEVLKPSGEGINLALNQLYVARNKAVYIGDSLDDIHASKEVGLRVGIFLSGESSKEDLVAAKPDYFIKGFGELLGRLERDFS